MIVGAGQIDDDTLKHGIATIKHAVVIHVNVHGTGDACGAKLSKVVICIHIILVQRDRAQHIGQVRTYDARNVILRIGTIQQSRGCVSVIV